MDSNPSAGIRRILPRRTRRPDMEPRTVLVVVPHLRENGGLRVSHEVARRLPSLGTPTELFVLQHIGQGAQFTPHPAVSMVYGVQRPARMRTALPVMFARLTRSARRAHVVLSGTEVGPALLLGWLAARLTRRPFAVLVQASLSGAMSEWVPARLHRITRRALSHADLAVCVSPGLVAEVAATGLPADRIAVVPVGVDVDAAIDAAAIPTRPVTDRPYVMALGRLVPQKGFDVLLEAYAATRAQLGEHHLVLVGEGPERARLEALAHRLGIADAVHFPGFIDNPQPLLARAALFVLPSRYEGMGGLVLLEAMSHGVPIIATDCVSGRRQLLEEGRIGRLVPPEDVDALATALAEHVADPEPLTARAVMGPRRARDFSPDRWTAELHQLLVARDRRPTRR